MEKLFIAPICSAVLRCSGRQGYEPIGPTTGTSQSGHTAKCFCFDKRGEEEEKPLS